MPVDVDKESVRELVLFAENDASLHRQSEEPIQKNLRKKMDKGTFDFEKSVKLWRYHADRAAKAYNKEFGGGTSGFGIFTVPVRNEAAREFAEQFAREEGLLSNRRPRG